jgi:predicted membrane channel-forming protein YqfA (hemolysin III family)
MTTEEKIETGIITIISVIATFLLMGAWRDWLATFILSVFSFLGLIGILIFRRQLDKRVATGSAICFLIMGVGALLIPLIDWLSSQR